MASSSLEDEEDEEDGCWLGIPPIAGIARIVSHVSRGVLLR